MNLQMMMTKVMTMQINEIFRRLGIAGLSPMQQAAGKAIRETDKDVVILSPTGTGKTLAYLLPLIDRVDASSDTVQALVVVPGRELALQSDNVLKQTGSQVRSTACYGGRPAMEEHKVIRRVRPHVVFGTPGRLNDHLDKDNISRYGIRYVVIDEFDKCLEMGFHNEMAKLMRSLPGLRRRILVSATDADEIPSFVSMKTAVRIESLPTDCDRRETGDVGVPVSVVHSPMKDKLGTLRQLLLQMGQESSVVFLNFRDSVERTANFLEAGGFTVSRLHGAMEQKDREASLYRFANGSANVLVATDLASRGLDIPDIRNIIHYHLPLDADAYTHRTGRTARWQASGRAFFLLGPEETLPNYVNNVTGDFEPDAASDLQPPMPRMATIYIGKGKKDKLSKGDIVGFLCKKGGLSPEDIGRIDVKERYAYVAVSRVYIEEVLAAVKGEKIKGIKTVIESVK